MVLGKLCYELNICLPSVRLQRKFWSLMTFEVPMMFNDIRGMDQCRKHTIRALASKTFLYIRVRFAWWVWSYWCTKRFLHPPHCFPIFITIQILLHWQSLMIRIRHLLSRMNASKHCIHGQLGSIVESFIPSLIAPPHGFDSIPSPSKLFTLFCTFPLR